MARARPRSRRRCRTCPEEPVAPPPPTPSPKLTIGSVEITEKNQGDRLWNHVLFGTNTCITMIAGYADAGMPGDPLPRLQEMVERLSAVITSLRERNAVRHPA